MHIYLSIYLSIYLYTYIYIYIYISIYKEKFNIYSSRKHFCTSMFTILCYIYTEQMQVPIHK